DKVRNIMANALLGWSDAAPVKFTEKEDAWAFEISIRETDRCFTAGCVLASSFFPDPWRHELTIYPIMFTQDKHDQVETLEHELGHVFGLRHFFAQRLETDAPSQLYGTQDRFTIMNYGADSKLTDTDKSDLKELYSLWWGGQLTKINDTPIQLMKPFH